MKKRILSLLLAFVMVLSLIPAMAPAARAADDYDIYVAGQGLTDGDYLQSNKTTNVVTKTKPSDNYAYYKDGILTLHNFVLEGYTNDQVNEIKGTVDGETAYCYSLIYSAKPLNIVVEGDCILGADTIAKKYIVIYSPAGVFITGGTLEVAVYGTVGNRAIAGISTDYMDSLQSANIIIDNCELIINESAFMDKGIVSKNNIYILRSSLTCKVDQEPIVAGGDIYISNCTGAATGTTGPLGEAYYNAAISSEQNGNITIIYSDFNAYANKNAVAADRDIIIRYSNMTASYGNYKIGVAKKVFDCANLVLGKELSVDHCSDSDYDEIEFDLGLLKNGVIRSVRFTSKTEAPGISGTISGVKDNTVTTVAVYKDGATSPVVVTKVVGNKGYSFKLTSGSYTIKATADGYSEYSKSITVGSSNMADHIAMEDATIKYIIAKSTEPIAGTVNTAPTITIAPECHCKVSDYMTGYWKYYDKDAGYMKNMDANTKFQVDKHYYYVFAVETTDGYTFPADGGNVNGILQCDQGYFGATVNRVEGRDDVAEMVLSYQPCTYGAPLEFVDQTPMHNGDSLHYAEGFPGETITFSFNHKPLTDAQKAQGFEVRRTFMVTEGLSKMLHKVENDTGTDPLSFSFTIDQTQTYLIAEKIDLVKDGVVLQGKSCVYGVKVVGNGTPVIFTADSSNSFGGTVTVDIDAMAKKDANLKTALDNGTVKYQWCRGGVQIPGATDRTYSFHADDVGKNIRVIVIYGDHGSISEPFEVGGTAPAFTKQPTGGNVAPDKTMTVKWATSFTPTKIVVDKYNFVGLASEYTTLSGTATSIELPANEYGYVIKAYYNDTDFITSNKFTIEEKAFVNPFIDVPEGSWYYEPVMWAVQNGVTTGATATTFNPNGNCLRAHVVTFLHRANGSPEPTSTNNPFSDVASGAFYYKPVLWAVGKNITNGTSATTFGAMENCNRAAVVTFLWRAKGSPEPKSTSNPFVDVATNAYYYKAVLWAVENGITNGVDATHFGPTAVCNRAQVVTFLHRAYK